MILHCWASRPAEAIGACWFGVRFAPSATCMLAAGHDGDHEWTDDDKITVAFAPDPGATP